ncbi:Phage protein Gp19/Gp15/Gp42 [Mycobacteroides abscessus subsp. abscessus]|uniref:Gp19/Gp15/Gp42 family protein n=1 Tax=Mycobacteroides abscessus TaxID=36809 RepID=UPI0009289C5A|nr:Gp19/Gp15/Gp42 family protein [Mycobacteroides abscessus]SHX54882.1 Phage protein Gp19/Gp15/Gp42 [Mycobacteroides abscessus subsp. abscessus]SHY09486.1 Phage protein Gp19/Gp15/Gp42 [Mycobacteroides abscessus subsp. abscessus]SIC45609.1 Phage protein Gp19/Gp15/Gp42 [Mycobacteroides abscessus subsp. abscessus]SID66922.1 Phage protein Gp19/Gp15/Gp42 [Mycobacteroides abscessus subsp. abscessus]SIF00386.1 Phage protein Gp19/Gp15/Gp42 [Mycobacteroides abscessus subsp. abscessus]
MAYATPADVSGRLGRELSTDEATMVATRLNDAELIIKSRIPDLDDQIDDDKIDVDLVKMIEANAVVRLVRNPNAYTGETDGNYSYQINWKTATGELEILDNEWALLGISQAMFVIAPNIPDITRCGEPEFWFPL